MKKLLIATLISLSSLDVFASGTQPTDIATPYCLPASPSIPVGTFISTGMVNPISNGSTTMELTDGTYYYVVTFSTGTGLVTSLPSCAVQYATKQ